MLKFILLGALAASSLCGDPLKIGIYGGVFEPGQYEIPSDEGLIGGIYLAGGIRGDGCPEHIYLRRNTEEGVKMILVDAWKIVFEDKPDVPLQDEDLILANTEFWKF